MKIKNTIHLLSLFTIGSLFALGPDDLADQISEETPRELTVLVPRDSSNERTYIAKFMGIEAILSRNGLLGPGVNSN